MADQSYLSIYAKSFNRVARNNNSADLIGSIQLEFIDWDKKRPAAEIFNEMKRLISDIPGIKVEFIKSKDGPASGKPIQLEFSSYDFSLISPAIAVGKLSFINKTFIIFSFLSFRSFPTSVNFI